MRAVPRVGAAKVEWTALSLAIVAVCATHDLHPPWATGVGIALGVGWGVVASSGAAGSKPWLHAVLVCATLAAVVMADGLRAIVVLSTEVMLGDACVRAFTSVSRARRRVSIARVALRANATVGRIAALTLALLITTLVVRIAYPLGPGGPGAVESAVACVCVALGVAFSTSKRLRARFT